MKLQFGPEAISSYQRLAYTPWHAIAEFVDNSTQSYFNNRASLDKAFARDKEALAVSIVYDKDRGGKLRVSDNAFGMSYDELERALIVGKPPVVNIGRCQFGMGLKTSACWIGAKWSVVTKRLGEPHEHHVDIDVDKVAKGVPDLSYRKVSKDKNLHYTIVEITQHHRRWHGRTLGKIQEFLSSFYRLDLKDGLLKLTWNTDEITWPDVDEKLLRAADGSLYKRPFKFKVDNRDVSGWVGILDHGSRAQAGFSILHRGRVVKGWPDSWRPEQIYGQYQGSNDLVNQRLVGEIHLDDFAVSHTKDDILWYGDQQDKVEEKLLEKCSEYREFALKRRKRTDDGAGPSQLEVDTAVDDFEKELGSPEVVDEIEIEDLPDPDAIREVQQKIIKITKALKPDFGAKIGSVTAKGYLRRDGSPSDPYVTVEATKPDVVMVIINMSHPHWRDLAGADGVKNYLRHCTYDALAEWKARRRTAKLDHDTIKMIKDRLLRIPMEMEQHALSDMPSPTGATGRAKVVPIVTRAAAERKGG